MSNHLKLLTLDSKLFAVLPVETVIRDRQEGCYAALAQADSAGESTPFVEFLLDALHVALNEAVTSNVEHTDPATDPDTDPVQKLLPLFREKTEQGIATLMVALGLSHPPTFRRNDLNPALAQGSVEYVLFLTGQKHPAQKYRLTEKGRQLIRCPVFHLVRPKPFRNVKSFCSR